jgi:polysaccharide biosynthesis transport protein
MFEAPRQVQSAVVASTESPVVHPAEFDIVKICTALWRGRTTILLTTAACLLLAVPLVLVAPHRYTATTEILIDPADLRAVADEATPSTQASDTALLLIGSQVRVLTSDDVLHRVVDSQGLAHDPEFASRPSALRTLENLVLTALGRRNGIAAADPSLVALNALRQHIRVTRAERTYVVDIAVTSEEAAKAARLANAVVQAYLVDQTAVRADAARQVSQSLSARLNELKESVHRAEERVEQFKASHNIVDADGHLVNEEQLADLNTQLAAARARTAAAKARLDEVGSVQESKDDIGAFPAAVQSQTITALRSQYAEIMRQEALQTTSLGARHPAVIEIHAQAERLKRMIDDEVNRIALAARADYQSVKASEGLLERNVDALKQAALTTDAALVNLRELQRDVQASRAVYEAFLVRARQTGAQESVDTKNIQVISGADVPLNRSSPPSNTIVALGAILLGVAAGSGLVLLRDAQPDAVPRMPSLPLARLRLPSLALPRRIFASKRKSAPPPDEPSPSVPVLAKLPGVDAIRGSAVPEEPDSRFTAGIRKVYETVLASHHKDSNPSILIVASHDDNDSAAVALTLAALAAAKHRVLLIDADLQRRTLSTIGADRSEAGLVDVAVGARRLADAVVRDGDTNINLIPFVSPKSRRDRKIEDGDVKAAFAQTKHFDVVIVAAMDLSRDPSARFFAGLVDHIVLVTRADKASRGAIDEIVSGLGVEARKVRGAVLTGAQAA